MAARSLLAVLLATACQAAPSGHSGFGSTPDITTAPASTGAGSTGVSSGSAGGTTSSGSGAASTSTGSESAAGTTTTIFDLGSETDVGDGKPAGCKGKIDFLFVISRDAGMELIQAQLVDAFPKFIATIQAKFKDFDYHIMVVDALAPYAGMIVGCYASALARIDFNQDDFDDVLVSSSCNSPPTNSPVNVFIGTGQTAFSDGIQTVVGSDAIAFAVSDFDGDQREDFATANQNGDDISLVLRTADGFADEKRIGEICPTCGNLLAISAGDIDGSGVADEIVAAVSTGPAVSLYLLMNPVEGPPLHAIALDDDTTRLFAVGDWNGDGISDIAAATPDGELALVLFLSTP